MTTTLDMPTTAIVPKLIGYPPAPTDGGPLESALPKIGEWAWQPKIDDRRVAIHAPSGTIYNQYGELSIADRQQDKFVNALAILRARVTYPNEWLDCGLMEYRHDMMRGCIVVFDIIDRTSSFDYRRAVLEATFPMLKMASEMAFPVSYKVFLINQWTTIEPLALWKLLQTENERIGRKFYEGLVAKRMDAGYPLGIRPKQKTHLWIKHRFDQ